MLSETKTFNITIDGKYVAKNYPSKLEKFLNMIL